MLIGSFVNLKSQGKNPQCQAVNASHKEGMLNWWQRLKPETQVWKKGPGLHALLRSLCHEVCPVRDCSAPVVPLQEEISGTATGKNCDNVKLFSSNHIIISFKYFIFIPHRNVTDRRTDRIAVSISRVSTLTRDNKNYVRQSLVAPLLMMLKHFTCTERSGPYHVSHTEAPGGGFLVLWLKWKVAGSLWLILAGGK